MCQESAKSSEEDDEMELRQLISFLQLCFRQQLAALVESGDGNLCSQLLEEGAHRGYGPADSWVWSAGFMRSYSHVVPIEPNRCAAR